MNIIEDSSVILTVSELNASARSLLEEAFTQVWIEGEISNLSQPSSGHCYFSLKDSAAQVRCAMFRMQRQRLKCILENGMHVLIRAQVSLYEPRGDYQLIVSHAEPAGAGLLQREFELLKQRLQEAGLFLDIHKKTLPKFPKQIGVITSATGAAIRDILHVLQRRFASIPVIIYPSQVQGERAAAQLVQAIEIANKRKECDLLILARGGGSIEDLWPFNDEKLAYAIFNSQIPIVSGVGHEIDFTIADFVADIRAPTPSAAAELVSPDASDYRHQLQQITQRMNYLMNALLQQGFMRLTTLSKRLQHPGQRLKEQAQRLDQLEQNLILAQKNYLMITQAKLNQLQLKLQILSPSNRITQELKLLGNIQQRLSVQFKHFLNQYQLNLNSIAGKLNAFNPLNTLERGYAIITKLSDEAIARSTKQLTVNELIQAQLADGKFTAKIVTLQSEKK